MLKVLLHSCEIWSSVHFESPRNPDFTCIGVLQYHWHQAEEFPRVHCCSVKCQVSQSRSVVVLHMGPQDEHKMIQFL